MFQIDRTYIDRENLDSLQGRIWDIRMDHKDDPTLPKLEHYHIKNEEEFEKYLDRKQNFLNFKESWRRKWFMLVFLPFAVVVALWSLFIRQEPMAGYLAGLGVSAVVILICQAIETYRAREFRNNPCETFIKALLYWDEHQKETRV